MRDLVTRLRAAGRRRDRDRGPRRRSSGRLAGRRLVRRRRGSRRCACSGRVALAVRREAGSDAGFPLARAQLARFALPLVGQRAGVALDAGLPSVRLSLAAASCRPALGCAGLRRRACGRVRPRGAARPERARRPAGAGRAVARPARSRKKILPGWAMRLLVAALLLPAALMIVDALRAARRGGERLARALLWVARLALPFAAARAAARAAWGCRGRSPRPRPAAAAGRGRRVDGAALDRDRLHVAALVALVGCCCAPGCARRACRVPTDSVAARAAARGLSRSRWSPGRQPVRGAAARAAGELLAAARRARGAPAAPARASLLVP